MKRLLLLLVYVCLGFSTKSQNFHKDFLLTPDTTVMSGVKYTLSYTSRLSIVNDNSVGIRGVHSGIKFGKGRHRLTMAYFWSNTNPEIRLFNFKKNSSSFLNLDGYVKKDFHYYNLMFYPYWLNVRRWKISTPIELGIGTSTTEGASFLNELRPIKKEQYFVPLQIGGYVEFKASRYVGINFEFGRRFIVKERGMQLALDGIYYGLGANLYTGPLWRDFKSWRKSAN